MRSYSFCVLRNKDRLDKYLALLFPVLSRSFIQKLIEDKQVKVNKIFENSHYLPEKKDVIELVIPGLKQTGIVAADIPLEILYEDKDVLVINKQAGLVVHPSDNGGHVSDSVVNALLFHRPETWSISNTNRPGIVHRLDKDTSGILVIAKNDKAMHYLSKQWQDRTVEKEYIALLAGKLTPEEGTIEAPLGRSSTDRKKIAVKVGAKSRNAITHYTVEKYFSRYTLVKVKIITGRTHQIRVHFKSIGFPVVGDTSYGKDSVNKLFEQEYGLTHQFLHAQRLKFKLPATKKEKEIIAPLPDQLNKILKELL